jgi:membrane protease subunit (stomatin/prohibitin family)
MGLGGFFRKQFIDVLQWTESEQGVLAWRFPMEDMEIQNGASLTVRESQLAVFVNEGRVADSFQPGRYTLTTQTLPLLTNLMNWDKFFESPFKSDVYFFSTRLQTAQRWGTQNPVTIRDRDFGMVRLRAFGMYSWRVADPVAFMQTMSGTREVYRVADVEPHLKNLVVSRMSEAFAQSQVPFLDMAASTFEVGRAIEAQLAPAFRELGLSLESFTVENLSLPEELQKRLDERIGMNMVGNLGDYARFQAAQAIPIAAANEGGGAAGLGAGLGAGAVIGQQMAQALGGGGSAPPPPTAPAGVPTPPAGPPAAAGMTPGAPADTPGASASPSLAPSTETKFCMHCGKSIPRAAKFCPECGGSQQ